MAGVVLALGLAGPAAAGSAPDEGVEWAPPPLPEPTFGISAPQVRWVPAADGTRLYTETYLPDPLPAGGVPVVVSYTPYASRGGPDDPHLIGLLVPRGYAVTFAHVRGSGGSEGCIEQTADHEVDDGARIVEDAGALAPWANGAVGMHGISYPGGTQIATATGPDRERLQYLKAVVVGAPVVSAYEFYNRDGVPQVLHGAAGALLYLLALSNLSDRPELILTDRLGCQPEVLAGSIDISGNYTDFYARRDHTRHLDRLEAATLMVHGSADRRVDSQQQIGLFDRIPATTPHVGLFGVWDHEWPDDYDFNGPLDPAVSPRRDWERIDWDATQFAWYERYLRGVDNGADGWPTQVQGTDGQWRTASTWPVVPGPERSLLLGGGGVLGATAPTGSTTYLETPLPELEAPGLPTDLLPGTTAVFTTAPFAERTEVMGAPSVDLWVQLLLPDSHLTARLEVVDAAGNRVTHESRTVGARSAMHLAPIVDGRFRQAAGRPAPIGTPVPVPIRFNPIDLVVPAGARLRLTVAGSSIVFDGLDGVSPGAGAVLQGPSLPSLLIQPVTILHDAAHPSALRFTLPEADSQLLDVQEADQPDFGAAAAPSPAAPAVPAGSDATASADASAGGGSLPTTGGSLPLVLPALAAVAALLVRRVHRVQRVR